ncbi:hypothetical protein A9Q84_11680 [Halobacteriovorax marinus]|uniref:Peptidase S54 rhomboid domain-containing protein n=1 Tax=Halobacteriovorax marinus TaxID=97084 RepID=A0A1Y5FDE6_9BACT|nr:hypothetical protein A9Q84_11680 [Halobacteriovorax marinus]
MIPFAQLADPKMAERITQELNKQGIQSSYSYDEAASIYTLVVEDQANFEQAQDIFRVMMGLPKKFEPSKEWEEIQSIPMGIVTKVTIGFCILVYVLNAFKILPELYSVMKISSSSNGLPEIVSQGQFWRLLTPAFLHFNFMHILFNMMWMKDLGKIIEHEKKSNFLMLFIVIVGIGSNFSQFLISGPNFGGMSGVVYGLLGYLWMYKKFNSNAQFSLPKSDVMLMIGWFFLCLIGVFSFSIANMAHAMGLTLGMLGGIFYGLKDASGSYSLKKSLLYVFLSLSLPVLTYGVEIFKVILKTKT